MARITNTLVTLVDPDPERRKTVVGSLGQLVRHVEPLIGLEDLLSRWPQAGILLIFDSGSTVADVQRAMQDRGHWRSHVAYAQTPRPSAVVDAIMGGAMDYLAWPFEREDVIQRMELWSLRSAQTGRYWRRRIRARKRLACLSRRELQVLKLIAQGESDAGIGTRLGISNRTSEIHRGNLLKKLGLKKSAVAARIVLEADLGIDA